MRFMIMHKMTEQMERGLPPDPATLEAIGKLIEEATQKKAFVSGEGLRPSSERVRIAYKGGKRTITDGPFTESKELIAGFALLRVRSKKEAIAWCDKFAAAFGDVELTMGRVVEPWDLGMAPRPKDPPIRFLAMHQADEQSENDAPPDPTVSERMGALVQEMTKAGVLDATDGLRSTKHGARLRFEGGERTVVDGPFAESKELVAGYAIFELPAKATAIEWATRFGEIVNVNEIDIRQMF